MRRQRYRRQDEGRDADRQVDVEDPAPAEVVRDVAAQRGADDRGQPEDRHQQADPLAAFLGREEVADDRLVDRHHRAAAETLEGAIEDELGHGVGLAAEGRADHEQHHADDEEHLAPVGVGELAPDRHAGGGCKQVRGGHPGVVRHAVEVGDDLRHGGAHDRLIDRRQQHAGHHAGQHQPRAPLAEVAPAVRLHRRVVSSGAHFEQLAGAFLRPAHQAAHACSLIRGAEEAAWRPQCSCGCSDAPAASARARVPAESARSDSSSSLSRRPSATDERLVRTESSSCSPSSVMETMMRRLSAGSASRRTRARWASRSTI